MVKTGDSLFNGLVVVAMLFSLTPLLIIFIRKVYHHAILNLLRVVCVFAFFQHLVLNIPGLLPTETISFIKAGFRLGEFILVFYLFKRVMLQKRVREFMNIFLVAFISVILTVYSLKGVDTYTVSISLLQSALLVLLAMVTFVQLISNHEIVLFREPLFWIAAGILCYNSMFIFMELVTNNRIGISAIQLQEKELVLCSVDIIQFLFFNIAALVAAPKVFPKEYPFQ